MTPKMHTLSTQGEFVNHLHSWQQLLFSQCIDKISIKHKVKQKEYLDSGKYPVIDQSQNFISGYCNNEIAIKITKPVIVFGDHTRCFKFVDFDFVAGADGIHILEPKDFFNEKLFYYFCLALDFPNKGYSRHYQYLAKATMKIPPLEIQRCIVKRLDEAFSRIENGTKHLKSARDNLTKYKQSLLKSAFNGTLTNDSPLSQGESANLPKSWQVKTLGEVCELCNGYAFKSSSFINKGVPIIRIGDIKNFEVDLTNARQVESSQEYENYQIQNGDLLIAMSGATTGKMGIYKLNNPAYLNQRVGNLKIKSNEIIPEYRNFVLYALQDEIYKRAYGGAQPNISKGAIESLKIPIPPLETQKQIVAILEGHFTSADKVSVYIDSCLSKAKQLKSSLLKSAFEGKLE